MSKYPGKIVSNLAPAGYSVFFDGTGDSIWTPTSAAVLGTNNWTFECWVYLNAKPSFGQVFGMRKGIATASDAYVPVVIAINTTGFAFYSSSNNSSWNVANAVGFGGTANINQWYHVAVVRNGSSIFGYVNGAQTTLVASTAANYTSTNSVYVGGGESGDNVNCYVSNARVVNGTAVYTAAFTPPTQLFNITNTSLLTCNSPTIIDQSNNAYAITVSGEARVSTVTPFAAYAPYNPALGASTPGAWTLDEAMQAQQTRRWNMYDPYFNQTTLLLRSSSADGTQNNQFLDSSNNNFTVTRSPTSGPSAPTQGTFSPFSLQPGQWGNFFDGSSTINYTQPALGNVYTVEFWTWPTAESNLFYVAGTGAPLIGYAGTPARLSAGRQGTWVITGGSANPTLNAWNHIALVREGTGANQFKLYLNGVLIGTGTEASAMAAQSATIGGAAAGSRVTAYISNLRIVNNTAVYTSNFTPPTAPLSPIANTELLTCQSNRLIDANTQVAAKTFTFTGTPSVQAFSPFLPTRAYTPTTIGGSGFLDGGIEDYLRVDGGSSLAFGSGDFSLEMFVYPTTSGTARKLYDGRPDAAGGNYPVLDITSSNTTRFLLNTSTLITGTAVIPANAWTHILVSRVSGNLRLFVNGVQDGSTLADSTNFINGTGRPAIGTRGSTLSGDIYSGYISSVRVLIGSGFTSVTVPTSPPSPTGSALCLNFTNAAITDATGKNNLETAGNAQASVSVRNTRLVTTPPTSMYFDGTGDWLFIPASLQNRLLGDFTIEFWVYATSIATTQQGIVAINDIASSGANSLAILLESTGKVSFWVDGNANRAQSADNVISANTWTYVALVRSGSTNTLYVNGSSVASNTRTPSWAANTAISVGRLYNDSTTIALFTGYIDDLRITRGIARYLAAFTPPRSRLQEQ